MINVPAAPEKQSEHGCGLDGFLFAEPSLNRFVDAIRRGFDTFRSQSRLAAMRRAAMKRPHGWERSASRYKEGYERARQAAAFAWGGTGNLAFRVSIPFAPRLFPAAGSLAAGKLNRSFLRCTDRLHLPAYLQSAHAQK